MRTISLLVAVSFLFSGCAAMFNGTKEQIHVQSEVPDTHFFLNEREIGEGTSAVVSIPKKKLKEAILRAEKPGCSEQSTMIETRFDAVSLLGILIDLGLISILVVDWAATGAITKADRRNYVLTPICTNQTATEAP